MSDFTIGHVTDTKEGPMDGVYAETKGTYTKFKGTGAFQKEKRILYQKVTDVGIKASLQTGMVSINDRNRNQAIAVSITEMVAVLNEALRYGTCRQCGRRILWVRMKSGKNMPVDMALHNYKKASTGKEKIVTPDGEVVTGRILVGERGDGAGYISHFASCKKYRR